MKVLSLIDSFKGTITSLKLGQITKEVLESFGHSVTSCAISDGGDGFLDAIMENIETTKVFVKMHDPFSRLINSYFLVSNGVAYIELAKASGINLVSGLELNPFIASTYGFGEMIDKAISMGYKEIVIGIGGSATNDCGSGMLEALGVKFNDGHLTSMNNEKLSKIVSVDDSILRSKIKDVKITVLSDVTNPLLGINGATYVFSPQKGACIENLPVLESNIKHFASFQEEYISYPGSGAAGGVGYALKTYLNALVESGIDYLLDLLDYDNLHKHYDLIITGEGKIDLQSLQGKVISRIIERTVSSNLILVCAKNELTDEVNFPFKVYSVVGESITSEMSLKKPEKYYKEMLNKLFKV